MKETVILGLGSRLMMDDGIGVYVVERLRDENPLEKLTYIVGETDIDHCLDAVRDAQYLVIIDAVSSGTTPGEVTAFSLDRVLGEPLRVWSAHNLHLFDLLPHFSDGIKGLLIGIEPSDTSFNLGLSNILTGRFGEITGKVKDIIQKTLI